MRKVTQSIVAIFSAAAFLSSGKLPTYADSLSTEQGALSQLQQQSNAIYSQISKEKTKETAIKVSLNKYQASLANVKQAIVLNQQQMNELSKEIDLLQEKIQENKKNLTQSKADLYARLRMMYEDGQVQYLAVLLHATSFDDLINRLNALAIITQQNHDLLMKVEHLQAELNQQNQQKANEYIQLTAKHRQLASLQQADMVLTDDQKQLLDQTRSHVAAEEQKQGLLESQIHLTQSQIQQIEEQTAEANALMQNSAYVQQTYSNLKSVNTSGLISYAESFLGVPYVWGGTSPSGFDCSGFTQFVLAHYGVYINRTSEEQFAEGIPVSRNNLQPGDLVFFSTYAPGASHVGIYIGSGLMVDAEDLGVSIDSVFNSYWGPKYIGARQMMK